MNQSPLILMYHGIKADDRSIPAAREVGAELYDVSLEQFHAQMMWLRKNQYRAIEIDEFDPDSPDKQVILTFDDGEMNNFIHALPVLQKFGLKAYFFIITDRIGKPCYMDWDALDQMAQAGMIVGSHSVTHAILTQLTPSQVQKELSNSLQCLVNHLGNRVNTLSIPRGFCNEQVIQIAYDIGYRQIFISERPASLRSQCWERIAVKGTWDLHRFEQAIRGEKPLGEHFIDFLKKIAKKWLKGKVYNHLRSALIQLTRSSNKKQLP